MGVWNTQFCKVLIAAVLAVGCAASYGQTSKREALIQRIEMAYAGPAVFDVDSPLLAQVLGGARAANVGVSAELWAALKPEFAVAITAVMRDDDGLLRNALRTGFASMSDEELDKLAGLLEDPVYVKFQGIMVGPIAQTAILKGTALKGMRLGGAINSVLSKHGLREVH